MGDMEDVEAVRQRYRPEPIETFFVGESAPASGAFFYRGNTAMLRNMRSAMGMASVESGDFPRKVQSLWLVSRRPRADARE